MFSETYEVNIDDIFEGPMDLLIHLIKKNEVDIYDIPIAEITNQYLAYLDWLKTMNVDLAGEFVVMASTLAHIKSRMLLPAHGEEDEDEDPRMEIVQPLEEYLRIKLAAEQLAERDLLGDNTFIRGSANEAYLANRDEEIIQIGLFELIDAFQKILENISPDHKVDISADRISVKERISQLVEIFEKKGSLTFNELFEGEITKSDVIVTFLAILEMVKVNLLRIAQHIQTGIIRLFYQ